MKLGLFLAGTAASWLAACGSSTSTLTQPHDGGAGMHGDAAAAGTNGGGGTGATGGSGAGGGNSGGGTSGGGTSGSGTCGNVEPCGGAVTGNWTYMDDCVNSATLLAAQTVCATASIGAVSTSVSGTLSLNSDMTYSVSRNLSAVIPWTIPMSCTGGMTCADFGASTATGLATGESFTCAGTSTCACTEMLILNSTDTGTYSTAGRNLTVTSTASGATSTGTYCVQGSTLHLISLDTTMNTGPMGQATIGEDTTLVKQ